MQLQQENQNRNILDLMAFKLDIARFLLRGGCDGHENQQSSKNEL